MWKVTRKGLAANKIRFVLTAVAVILGVAFVSGTLVLTATIQKTFDDLFADIYRTPTRSCARPSVLSSDFGTGERPNVPSSLLADVQSAPGVAAAEGDVQVALRAGRRQERQGDRQSRDRVRRRSGFAWHPESELSVVPPRRRLGPAHATTGRRSTRTPPTRRSLKIGDNVTILTTLSPRTYILVGIVKFGDANSLAGASASLFTVPEAQRLANAPNEFSQISVAAEPGVSQTEVRTQHRAALEGAAARTSTR